MARLLPSAVMELTSPQTVPVRCVVGRLHGEAIPLEEGAPEAAGTGLSPSVAADDQRVLSALLEEVTRRGPPDWEGRSARAWNLGGNGLTRRVEEVLEELEVRPLNALPSESALTALLPLSEPGLRLAPYHRGLRALPTFEEATFLRLVAEYARVYELDSDLRTPVGRAEALGRLASLATGHHAYLLVLPGGRARILRIRQALELTQIRAVPRNPTLRGLDLVLLESLVLRTVLGVQAPERADHPQVLPVADFEVLVEQVLSGALQAGFALNPPPAWEVRAVMQVQQRLPPRTLRVQPELPPDAVGYRPA